MFNIIYQIKLNGFNPRNWCRRASKELQNPTPVVVLSKHRRGVLRLKDKDSLFTRANGWQLIEWIWVWLK
jgi:hypothetical protein